MVNLEDAYKTVFIDLLHNAPTVFQGEHADKHNIHFMHGIGAVMGFLAGMSDSSGELFKEFAALFDYNLAQGKENIK